MKLYLIKNEHEHFYAGYKYDASTPDRFRAVFNEVKNDAEYTIYGAIVPESQLAETLADLALHGHNVITILIPQA